MRSVTLIRHRWDVDPVIDLFSSLSMQQGKMFFFIGVIMALIQGGYARRIKPGHHIRAVRMVGHSPKEHHMLQTFIFRIFVLSMTFQFHFRQS